MPIAGLTDTDVANRALHYIGAGSINIADYTMAGTNPTTASKPANLTRMYLPQAIEDVLTRYAFPRTIARQDMIPTASDYDEWVFRCALPADYILDHKLESNADFEIVGQYLYTDDDSPTLIYVASNASGAWNWGTLGSALVQAIAARLAVLICSDLTPDQNTKMRVMQEAEIAIVRANSQAQRERFGIRKPGTYWGDESI